METKPKLSYILDFPNAVEAICRAMEKSEQDEKYTRFGWKDGCQYSESMDSVLRHAIAFHNCENVDEQTQVSHLALVAVNAMFALENLARQSVAGELDDRDYKHEAE